jgi:hypothetical protein
VSAKQVWHRDVAINVGPQHPPTQGGNYGLIEHCQGVGEWPGILEYHPDECTI